MSTKRIEDEYRMNGDVCTLHQSKDALQTEAKAGKLGGAQQIFQDLVKEHWCDFQTEALQWGAVEHGMVRVDLHREFAAFISRALPPQRRKGLPQGKVTKEKIARPTKLDLADQGGGEPNQSHELTWFCRRKKKASAKFTELSKYTK